MASSHVAGGTAVVVKNSNSFLYEYAVQVGKTGEENSEIVVIDTPEANGTLPITAAGTLLRDHGQDTPVYNIHYDQLVLLRSTVGTSGTAAGFATTPITSDFQFTKYDDTTGAAAYAYKIQYLNSVSGDRSSESDWFTPAGPSYYSLQKIRQRVKDALYNASYIKSDKVIADWINEWLELMTNAAIKVNQGYSIGTTSATFGTASLGTITDSDFKQVNKMELTFDGINYALSTEISLNRFSATDVFTSVYPRHSWIGDTVFQVLPSNVAGTARITYSKRPVILVDEIDDLPMSLRSYTTSCINYVLYRAYANDNKPDLAEQYYQKFVMGKNDFVNEVTPRDATGPKTIDLVEGLSGMNDGILIGSDWII